MTKYLHSYSDFSNIRNMNIQELNEFAQEIRQFLIEVFLKQEDTWLQI